MLTGSEHGRPQFLAEYQQFKDHPVYGHYIFMKPIPMIKDLDLVKAVMVKDFDHFVDRSMRNLTSKDSKNSSKSEQVWEKQVNPCFTNFLHLKHTLHCLSVCRWQA